MLSPQLQARILRWKREPWRFAHDAMRWDGDSGGVAPLVLEDYQREFMMSRRRFRGVNKSRQIGYSFIFAVESLTRAILDPGHTSMFVSYNQDDAREKINYVHKLYELSPALKHLADFDLLKNEVRVRRHGQKKWSLIRSLPCRPARGKTKADLYLDEIAHYQDAKEVYLGSVPASVRAGEGAGQVTVASTPNGRLGIFWECIEGQRSRTFWTQTVPWWKSRYLCKDTVAAEVDAPRLTTDERVEKYGLTVLQEVFAGMALPDFQQEFEAEFIDEGLSYFPMELINSNVVPNYALATDLDELIARKQGSIYVGVDIGRHKDNTELTFLDRYQYDDPENGTGWAYSPLMVMTFDRMNHVNQLNEIKRVMEKPDLVDHLWIDATGMGSPVYDALKESYWERVTGVVFSAPVKENMAVLTRRVFERGLIDIPDPEIRDVKKQRVARELIDQIHSIKRTPLQGRNARYEAESTTHHGDQFWSLALSLLCAQDDLKPERDSNEIRVIG